MHGGDRRVPGGTELLQPREKLFQVNTWGANHFGARHDRGKHCADKSMNMKKRHDVEAAIVFSELESGCYVAR